jgi:hypothetical protein
MVKTFSFKGIKIKKILKIEQKNSSDFIITASVDGHVKFWKKQEEGIEFVKHFRAHLG